MIKQLQRRFIRIAVVTLTVAMVLVVCVVNVANWISVRGELGDTMTLIIQSGPESAEMDMGAGPQEEGERPPMPPDLPSNNPEGRLESPPVTGGDLAETPPPKPEGSPDQERTRHSRNMVSEANWFRAMVEEDGTVENLMMDQIENLDEATAQELVVQAAADGRSEGFLQDYLFRVLTMRSGARQVVLLNCETRLTRLRTLILISAVACAAGILLAWLLVTLASRRAVEPTIRNMEQQKQFITNASHELKTPLTVISTNMELLDMELDGNPWVRSTQKQTAAMRRLVDELVYLSRMEEEHPSLTMEKLDPGSLLEETAEPFAAMAEYGGKEMTVETEKGLRMTADRASLQRLMSTLCDNAVKYASEGPIRAEIRGDGRNQVLLRVSNPVAEPLTREQCDQLFHRFYRVDESRNKDKQSGFGIGLAIAAAIAEKHGGRISAAMEGNRLVFSCVLPREAKG